MDLGRVAQREYWRYRRLLHDLQQVPRTGRRSERHHVRGGRHAHLPYHNLAVSSDSPLPPGDSQPPSPPTITSPQDNSYDKDGSFSVSGTAEAASTVELFEGTTSKGTTTADSSSGAWSIALSGVSDGSHTYTARATDAASNTSPASNSVTVTVDSAPPQTNIASGPSGPTNDTTPAFSFSGSDNLSQAANLSYSYKVDGGAWSAYLLRRASRWGVPRDSLRALTPSM